MNILLVTYSFYPVMGGVEYEVKKLAEKYLSLGHRVIVLTSNRVIIDLKTKHLFSKYREIINGILVERFPFDYPKHLNSGKLLDKYFFSMNLFKFILRYLSILTSYKIQVVHSHFLNIDSYYLSCAKKYFDFKWILTCHGGDTSQWVRQSPHRAMIARQILEAVNHITTVSDEVRTEAIAINPSVRSKITFIPNGIDSSLGNLAPRFSSKAPYILFVGRFSEQKGVEVLLRAFASIASRIPNHELVLVGDGSLRHSLVTLCHTLNIENKVIFKGLRSNQKVFSFMKGASCIAIPSKYEGLPITLLEAMLMKIPIVASNIPSICEVVKDHETALLFESGNPDDLAMKILALLGSSDLTITLTNNAFELVNRKYTFEKTTADYLNCYKNVLT